MSPDQSLAPPCDATLRAPSSRSHPITEASHASSDVADATTHEPRAKPVDPSVRLPMSTLLVYSAPAMGQAFMFMFTGMYLLKYSTDVLGVAPAAMGAIFMVSRLWDAVSDPLAGYLSDRTRSRWGRRRPWLLLGAGPVSLTFFFMLTPPADLSGPALTTWMTITVIAFYTAMTVYNMPHDALGAELSSDYTERNRVFGIKRAVFGIGSLALFGCLGWLASSDAPRQTAFTLAVVVGIVSLGLMWLPAFFLRERPEFQGRGAKLPFKAIGDVLRNRHARVLVAVFFLQQMGIGGVSLMVAYYADYILGDPTYLMWLMGSLFLVSTLSIPVWVRLGAYFEKRTLVLVSMTMVGISLAALGFVPMGGVWQSLIIAIVAGFSIACLDVVLPSIQADVIDYDELQTGERKEGIYFAVWHLAQKSAMGISAAMVGFLLQGAGFAPNAEQSPETIHAIRLVMSSIPVVVYGGGTLLFWFFRMSRREHAEVLATLEARRAAARHA
jgi:GPH family glycoside/pentoside/hexuronide:cation symporter